MSVDNERTDADQDALNEAELNAQAETPEANASADEAEVQSRDETSGKDWEAEAKALAQQIEEMKDQTVRAQAEMQNVRRRAEMDVEKAHKFALEKFAKELLPVIDSLENALEAEKALGNESNPLREGVEMTLGMFLSGVKKFHLEQIDPVGKPFDPSLHEAMSMVESPDAEPNTVIAAMQKGYTLSGRLVRPAMVVVAKGATKVDEQA